MRRDSARGVVVAHLHVKADTISGLCDRIGRTPALGDKGNQPASAGNVKAALTYIRKRLEESTKFRLVEKGGVYSIEVM
jgi:hypothetical protein